MARRPPELWRGEGLKAVTTLGIDARMIRSSGIGTILANTIPRIIAKRPDWAIRLLGDPALLDQFAWRDAPNLSIIPFTAEIYTVAEQTSWPHGQTRDCDVFWSPNYNIPLFLRPPLLVNVNDVAHLALPDVFTGVAKRLFARTMFGRVRRRADAIVFISQFSADEFGRLVGSPKGRPYVVHCGVDEEWFKIEPGPKKRQAPYLLFVGNVKPHKNLRRLLEAFELVYRQIPQDLLIVGRKEGFITGDTDVQLMIDRFGGRVAFTGYVDDAVLKRIYAQADALVLPSLYEGFGLPPIEAMAAGCPALVSRAASMPEVCGDAALYFDPFDIRDMADKLARIVTDQQLRETLRAAGKRRAAQLTWDANTDGYLTAMADLLRHGRAKAG